MAWRRVAQIACKMGLSRGPEDRRPAWRAENNLCPSACCSLQHDLCQRDLAKLEYLLGHEFTPLFQKHADSHAPADCHRHAFIAQRTIGQDVLEPPPFIE